MKNMKDASVVDTTNMNFKDIKNAFDIRYIYLVKEILTQYDRLLELSDNWERTSFVTAISEVFEKEKVLLEKQVCDMQLSSGKGYILFENMITTMKEIENYIGKKGKYYYQRYDRERIVIDHGKLTLTLLPEKLSAMPYENIKDKNITQKEQDKLLAITNAHSKVAHLRDDHGHSSYNDWNKKVSKNKFNKILEIIGQNKDIVVMPVNMDCGFSFGITLYKWIGAPVVGVPDEKEVLFQISEKYFPDEYTSMQIFDEIVMNEWNVEHVKKYLGRNIAGKKISNYEY